MTDFGNVLGCLQMPASGVSFRKSASDACNWCSNLENVELDLDLSRWMLRYRRADDNGQCFLYFVLLSSLT